jgi:60 kDa SS-A/Ro ribonucleoprotein
MARKYSQLYNRETPQSEKMDSRQVKNNAGGYVFEVTPWVRLERFLILGSDQPTYYQHAEDLTRENAKCVDECWGLDAHKTAKIIREISDSGRAPKNDPAIYALALGATHESVPARQAAYVSVPVVARTASALFRWMAFCSDLGKGSGRGYKRVLADWYFHRPTNDIAFQAVKYRQRDGYTHKRAIELSNMGPSSTDEARVNLYKWMRGKETEVSGKLPDIVEGHIEAMSLKPTEGRRLANLITSYKLPWEAIPTWALSDSGIWEALIPTVGLTALIRNLGNMTACGALTMSNHEAVTSRLLNEKALDKARIHPFNVLQALSIYKVGYGLRGKKTWQPVMKVVDALDEAFYKCFKYVEPTGKRILVALDVSGSMCSPIGAPKKNKFGRFDGRAGDERPNPLTCREASAAMCLVMLKTEPHCDVIGFTTSAHGSYSSRNSSCWNNRAVTPLKISARQRLDDVVAYTAKLPFSGTDCALPMLWANDANHKYDAIVIYTDNETWSGTVHPKEALVKYRRNMGLDTKLIVCGMTSTGFSIADPTDNGMLDIVGLDSAVPSLISNFVGVKA